MYRTVQSSFLASFNVGFYGLFILVGLGLRVWGSQETDALLTFQRQRRITGPA